jgi:hypothetical protein
MAADSGAGIGARFLMIIAVVFALGYACADRAQTRHAPTPAPSIGTEVTR